MISITKAGIGQQLRSNWQCLTIVPSSSVQHDRQTNKYESMLDTNSRPRVRCIVTEIPRDVRSPELRFAPGTRCLGVAPIDVSSVDRERLAVTVHRSRPEPPRGVLVFRLRERVSERSRPHLAEGRSGAGDMGLSD